MTNDEVINNDIRKSISYELSRHLFSFNTLVTVTKRLFSIHKCAFYNGFIIYKLFEMFILISYVMITTNIIEIIAIGTEY